MLAAARAEHRTPLKQTARSMQKQPCTQMNCPTQKPFAAEVLVYEMLSMTELGPTALQILQTSRAPSKGRNSHPRLANSCTTCPAPSRPALQACHRLHVAGQGKRPMQGRGGGKELRASAKESDKEEDESRASAPRKNDAKCFLTVKWRTLPGEAKGVLATQPERRPGRQWPTRTQPPASCNGEQVAAGAAAQRPGHTVLETWHITAEHPTLS